jgi:hypothetical protein
MSHEATTLYALTSFENVILAHDLAKQHMSQALSAFEFLDAASMELALKHVPDSKRFFAENYPMYILLEIAGVIFNDSKCKSPCTTSILKSVNGSTLHAVFFGMYTRVLVAHIVRYSGHPLHQKLSELSHAFTQPGIEVSFIVLLPNGIEVGLQL